MNHFLKVYLVAFTMLAFFSCSKEAKLEKDIEKAAEHYTVMVKANYDDAYDATLELKNKIDAFVSNPTEAGFVACKNQWLAARNPYGQTEAFRFYNGPIDNEENGPEGLINAWPMDENYIDYVDGDADAGLINSPETYPTISKEVLADLNEKLAETSIFTGYHAIEFLLWGQDLYSDSPGKRPYTDYVTDGSGTAKNQDRRGLYLKTVAELLVEHLDEVRSQWGTNGAFQKTWLEQSRNKIITDIFTSLGELSKGELAGERMFVAVDKQDQENEHSCFADNTIADIKMNYQGIVNVYTGTYKRIDDTTVSGSSFKDAAIRADEDKADAIDTQMALVTEKINAIPDPFDQAILNDKQKVLDAVSALETLSDKFAEIAPLLKSK